VAQTKQRESTGRHAALVSSGILLTRLIGFVRQWIFAGQFGLSPIAAAWGAAFRIPNMLQTLFGEGVLSASFIPVYAKLLAQEDEEEAGRVAGAVAAILALATAVIVLLGVLAAPFVTDLIVGGFHGATRELTIRLVRVLFPGAGLLVLSAWCLGILNSHRKFFLSYTAPVLWNLAMIATLLVFRRMNPERLIVALAWGSVLGSALQFAVQLPVVLRLARHIRVRLATHDAEVREVVRNFVPVFISRGVVQISAYVDVFLASYLPEIAVAGLTNAQTLYTLPVSLFGMAVSAAELPAMSSALGDASQVSRLPAAASEFRAAPDCLLRGALGDGVSGARRRHCIRCFSTESSRAPIPCTCGVSSPGRPWDCWHRLSAGCIPPLTTLCATHGRRCDSR
jgi:putative peptidoglycan lipid II flippase